MNENQRNTLQRHRRRLADDLILTEEFLAQTIEEGIFEWGMVSIIKAEKTETDQIYKMLELLPKRGPHAFDRFLTVLEKDYPWLATLLISSTKSTQIRDHPVRESIRPELVSLEMNSRGTPGMLEGFCDADIKKLVASFVHRQFGQSKRISEKDKKAVEKFVSEQLQQERTRYQAMLPSSSGQLLASCPSSMSEGDEDVFDALEVQDHLFRIHMKIEPHLSESEDQDDDSGNNNKSSGIRERILPDDLNFEVIHKEMDLLCKKLCHMETQVRQSMDHFKAEVQHTPLHNLVGRMHEVLRKQQTELEESEDHNRRLLDEVHRYSEHIEKLEKDRREYRAQVNVLHQDMAKVRQEKMAIQQRFTELERSHKERLEKESTLDNLRLIVKDLRSHTGLTPRQALMGEEGGTRKGEVRRSMRGSQMKQGVSYPLYARRYTPNTRVIAKKKNNNTSSNNK